MRSKTSPSGELRSFLIGLIERGEDVVQVLREDLLASPGAQLGKTAGRAAEAKKRVDENIQFVLSALSLPSRADYQRLSTKVDALQGSLVNVSMKLDRLLAAEAPAPPRPVRARPAGAKKGVRKPSRTRRDG